MFSIDLLKGQGLPERVDPKRLALKALPILVPLLAVALFASTYQHDRVQLKKQQQQLKDNQQQIALHHKDVSEYNRRNAAIKDMEKCLGDISKALDYRMQVSGVLIELVEKLPETIFVSEMDLNRNTAQEKIQTEGSGMVTQQLVVRRSLNLVVCGYDPEESDAAVQAYINDLKQSPVLAEVFAKINPPTRQQGKVDGRNAIYYEIKCELREQR